NVASECVTLFLEPEPGFLVKQDRTATRRHAVVRVVVVSETCATDCHAHCDAPRGILGSLKHYHRDLTSAQADVTTPAVPTPRRRCAHHTSGQTPMPFT